MVAKTMLTLNPIANLKFHLGVQTNVEGWTVSGGISIFKIKIMMPWVNPGYVIEDN